MNKVDQFFKSKLEDLSIEPGVNAWANLEANLQKKNKGSILFRIAAVFMLLGMSIAAIIWLDKGTTDKQLADQLKRKPSTNVAADTKLKEDNIKQSTIIIPTAKTFSKKITSTIKTQLINNEQNVAQAIKQEVNIDSTDKILIELKSTEKFAVITVKEKPIVIEYTLESVGYLKKENPVVAESIEKKTSLQKALDFAREAKNSDSGLGNLRQAKDDLFALNFKKDKQKNQ